MMKFIRIWKPLHRLYQFQKSKDQLIDGQLYNVNGQSMKWNKKKDNFE
jgi:hypothetical protein